MLAAQRLPSNYKSSLLCQMIIISILFLTAQFETYQFTFEKIYGPNIDEKASSSMKMYSVKYMHHPVRLNL